MRGNFSLTQFPTSEKGALWIQQGRPILDSDWNAQITLAEEAVRKKIENLIGKAGGSASSAGFELKPIAGLDVNKADGPTELAEGIFLQTNPSLPFPIDEMPARPFHLQVGFKLQKVAAGCLFHIPGLFVVSMTTANRLNITTVGLDEDGNRKKTSATGKKILTPNKLERLHVVFDGEYVNIFVHTSQSAKPKEPDVSLLIGNPMPIGFDALALVLGCAQKTEATKDEAGKILQSDSFFSRLEASFWHLSIIDDFLEFAQNLSLGDDLDRHQAGLVCALDFQAIKDFWLKDRSPAKNDGLLLFRAEQPRLSLLDVTVSDGDYIAHGRYYENAKPCFVSDQPNLPPEPVPSLPISGQSHQHLRFYLDCWQRLVTDLEAPANHDTALGNIDTTAGLRNVWQVKSLSAPSEQALQENWTQLVETPKSAQIKIRRRDNYLALKNGLLRVEIHHSGLAASWPIASQAVPRALATRLVNHKRQELHLEASPDSDELLQLDRPILVFSAQTDDSGLPLITDTTEHVITNLIEISKVKNGHTLNIAAAAPKEKKGWSLFILPVASFKYSKKNGCLSYPIAEMNWLDDQSGLSTYLTFPGYNGLEIKNGDWMELGNLALEQTSQPGPMFLVDNFMSDRLQLLLSTQTGFSSTSDGKVDLGTYPTLTIWEGRFSVDGPPQVISGWIDLADGIEMKFESDGYYKSGDYWTAPIRKASKMGVIWPGIDTDKPEFQTREGPIHQLVTLADFHIEPTRIKSKDRRKIFRSLINEPFADLDDKTAKVLRETALFMEMIGLPDWQLTREDLPDFIRDAIQRVFHELYGGDLRLLGVEPEAPEGFAATGQEITFPIDNFYEWSMSDWVPETMQGDGFCAELAGRPVYINQKNNGIWTYQSEHATWRLLTHVPDERHAYSVAWDHERLYIVGGRRHGLLSDGAARRVLALNSMGEWHTVGFITHYTGYPTVACIGDNLLVAGGVNFEGDSVMRVGYVDLKRRRWRSLGTDTPNLGAYTSSVAHDGQWYIFGGERKLNENGIFEISNQVQVFDPVTRDWHSRSPMPVPLAGHQTFHTGEDILVVGGKISGGEFSCACYRYNPEKDSWCEAGLISEPRAFFGLLKRMDNRKPHLSCVGGMIEEGIFSERTDICPLDQTLYLYE